MSSIKRRDFIKSAMTTGCLAIGGMSCIKSRNVEFKYAMCNESMQGMPWEKQCAIVANAGYTGIEIAAFTLVEEGVQEISLKQRQKMVKTMKDTGLECVGLHWLLAPPPTGLHFTTPDKTVRSKTIAYFKKLIDFCGDLNGKFMIFGSPKQRNAVGVSVQEANQYFADGLARTADHAQQRGVKILVEPLDSTQTDTINTLAEAVNLVNTVGHPAVRTMFDFHNTADETDSFKDLIKKYYDYIEHVHVQEMDGDYLGTGDAVHTYVDAFKTLNELDYNQWISLEVFNFDPDPRVIAEQSMKTLKAIEKKLG